jgi:hypothetical protein
MSYVIARDFGFAPNPFHGYCTLATCKPVIRKTGRVGDWVVGTGSVDTGMEDRVVFAMQVAEAMDFDAYWNDHRFRRKRPNLAGSLKQVYGDNIYHHGPDGEWIQEDSHHSLGDGRKNQENADSDLSVDRVLVGMRFAYWGSSAPTLPADLRGAEGIKAGRGHRVKFDDGTVARFLEWLMPEMGDGGCIGEPCAFHQHPRNNQLNLFGRRT